MSIHTLNYVIAGDFPTEAQKAYREFVQKCGLHNGEFWSWEVGDIGSCSVPASYIGNEKCVLIDTVLIGYGLKSGEIISVMFDW